MNEKEFLQKIKDDAEQISPPNSLSPDAIEQLLHGMQMRADKSGCTADAEDASSQMQRESAVQTSKSTFSSQTQDAKATHTPRHTAPERSTAMKNTNKKVHRFLPRLGAAAAVFVLAFLVVGLAGRITRKNDSSESSNVQTESDGILTASLMNGNDETADPFTYASSYEEIYEAIYDLYSDVDMAYGVAADYDGASSDTSSFARSSGSSSASSSSAAADAAEEEVMAIEDSIEDVADTGASDDADYSTTNIQEAGVDEADIVKTDGTYIYILRTSGEFLIVCARDEMELVSQTTIESDNDLNALELYLDGDTLSVITSEYETTLGSTDDSIYYTYSSGITALYTWDISDRAEPTLIGRVTQEGYYSDSRKVGDYIYLFTGWYPTIGTSYAESTITPLLNGKAADASSYYLPETLTDSECLIISSVDITSPSEFADNKILVSGAQDFYVSQENIYIMNQRWQSQTVTEITKFHYEDGQITGVAAGTVTGYLNDSFSMSEYNGYLRLVTTYYGDNVSPTATVTDWTEHNALFILGETLNQVSVIADLAEGETIRSARFLGDTGYFVTFRQTDPLFSVDLSDPENPQILGELKISGFSTYLHFYGESLLLGLGYEADESTGTTTGLKLSMFDISDPSNVTEVGKYVITGVTWCASLYEYKSILVDASKNLIGFYCDDRYLLFSYDEGTGFVQELIYDFYSDQLVGEASAYTMRGLYIGDDFYLAGSSFVIRFDMSDGFAKTEVLTLE